MGEGGAKTGKRSELLGKSQNGKEQSRMSGKKLDLNQTQLIPT